jgi:hypothetical protein
MKEIFRRLAEKAAHAVGSYWAFLIALLAIVVWALTGPYFNYSDTWQLFINTGTTIVTFLMVFLIQNTQNRETRIVALKLDELLRGVEGARTGTCRTRTLSSLGRNLPGCVTSTHPLSMMILPTSNANYRRGNVKAKR